MAHYKPRTKLLISLSATVLLIGCSTRLANRSSFDIASSSVRRTDTLSGVSEVLAPQIKAFSSSRSSVTGQVQLRTAGPFTDDKGIVHRDGAYLEVLLNYATATPYPDDALFFDQASWPGGEPTLIADFGTAVLDCREDVREIYQFPSPHYGTGYYGNGRGHGGRRGRGHGGRRNGHGDGDHDDNDHDDGGDADDDGASDTPPPARRPRRPRPENPETGTPDPDIDDSDLVADTPTPDPLPRPGNFPTTRPIPGSVPRTRTEKRVIYEPSPEPRRRQTSAGTRPVIAPASRPSPNPVMRPAPGISPQPASQPVFRPAPHPRPTPTPKTSPKSKPSVDRVFGNTENRRTRPRQKINTELNYHPQSGYAQTGYRDYVVRYSCERQESLRVFVPRERLIAAERTGLLVYLRPRAGIEETIALPPNYVAGFMMAAYSPQGQRLTIPERSNPDDHIPANTPIIYGGP